MVQAQVPCVEHVGRCAELGGNSGEVVGIRDQVGLVVCMVATEGRLGWTVVGSGDRGQCGRKCRRSRPYRQNRSFRYSCGCRCSRGGFSSGGARPSGSVEFGCLEVSADGLVGLLHVMASGCWGSVFLERKVVYPFVS